MDLFHNVFFNNAKTPKQTRTCGREDAELQILIKNLQDCATSKCVNLLLVTGEQCCANSDPVGSETFSLTGSRINHSGFTTLLAVWIRIRVMRALLDPDLHAA